MGKLARSTMAFFSIYTSVALHVWFVVLMELLQLKALIVSSGKKKGDTKPLTFKSSGLRVSEYESLACLSLLGCRKKLNELSRMSR